MVRLSNIELLDVLRENARTPYKEIAKRLGVSDTAVRKRIRKLEEDKVITRYTVEVDSSKIGLPVQALIGVDTEAEDYISVLEALRDDDQVDTLYSSSGDHMIMAKALFKDSGELASFIRKLGSMGGVKKICPAIIHERLK